MFTTDDLNAEYERLIRRGVVFTAKTVRAGPMTQAVFNDTCGNLIMLARAP